MKSKRYQSINYILIIISLGIIGFTVYFKNQAQWNYVEMDIMMDSLEFQTDIKKTEADVKSKFIAFTYFDEATENQVNNVFDIMKKALAESLDDETYKINLELEISNLKNLLHTRQQQLISGYDNLFYCALVLFLIAVIVIIYDLFSVRNEINRIQTINEEQLKFSRDLHDGVAQDLAALKIYLEKKDDEKSSFYAERAFNEVRYLIDSMHTDLSKPLSQIFDETLTNFEINYKITTHFLNGSENLDKITADKQMELLRIFQEALSNIARHANATEVTVQLIEVGNDLKFNIKDNGIGFEIEDLQNQSRNDERKHYGVKNIEERVHNLGGSVQFINQGGTTIAITIKNLVC